VNGLYLGTYIDSKWSKEYIKSPIRVDDNNSDITNPVIQAIDTFSGRHWYLPMAAYDYYPQLEYSNQTGFVPHSMPPMFKDHSVARIWLEDVRRGTNHDSSILGALKRGLDTVTEITLMLIKPHGKKYLSYPQIADIMQLNTAEFVEEIAQEIETGVRENAESNTPKRIKQREKHYFLTMLRERLSPSAIAIREGVGTRNVQMRIQKVREKMFRFRLFPTQKHIRSTLL
jgi:hypothetical protein